MITEWILGLLFAFVGWLIGSLPTVEIPEWVGTVNTYATDGVTAMNGFHNWVPLDGVRNALLFLTTCGAAVFIVRVTRIVISHFTGGGGGAA